MGDEYDVVVLGTGAAGLVAALAAHDAGARVALCEKAPMVGGTTALSAGIAWLPATPVQAGLGIDDSVDDAVTYLMSLSNGLIDERYARTYCETAGELVRWLHAATPLRLELIRYPDYHPENPGGRADGVRSLEPALFSFHELGEWAARVMPSEWDVGRMQFREMALGGGKGELDVDVARARVEGDIDALGQAVVGRLLRGCLDRSIVPMTSTRATELVVEDGRVCGVRAEREGEPLELRASQGVVLASGGFEFDTELVTAFLRGPLDTAPAGISENTGDGLRMAMRVGAQLGTMREAWWVPLVEIPGARHYGHQHVCIILRERTVPGSLMVNRRGRRFTNEAANYNALGGAFHVLDSSTFEYQNLPCWVVMDHACFERYGFLAAGVRPGDPAPDWLTSAASPAELAVAIGVPPAELQATIDRFNEHASAGHDPDFGRGKSAYDGFNGDQSLPGTAATLGRLGTAPYYAMRVHSGTIGTKGGPRTDVDARVLDVDGRVIEGLYAAGNAGAGWTGMAYAGAGGTIGPAMVTGYRAGGHAGAVGRSERPRTVETVAAP